ncbi:MAG: hypothetical protein F6J96_19805 [Symploca sp. SIO1C2]|nr:hypothetical protein [Symploca sp. SIO1C2]
MGQDWESAIVQQFADSSPVLDNLTFRTIQGNALRYNRQEKMPGVGFRGLNESFEESTGVMNPQVETLAIAGGYLDVDLSLMRSFGEGIRSDEELNKVDSLALSWTRTFFKGDSSINPREFDGLQRRLTGTQVIDAGNSSGGDPLSLRALDRTISRVRRRRRSRGDDDLRLFMNLEMKLQMQAAIRDTAVAGFITLIPDDFGREVMRYQGIIIEALEQDNNGEDILPFAEANPGGGTPASTSIYCVCFGDLMVEGLQNMEIEVRDLGELQSKPCMRTVVEWEAGVAVMDGRAAARLQGVIDAPIVA